MLYILGMVLLPIFRPPAERKVLDILCVLALLPIADASTFTNSRMPSAETNASIYL